MPSRTYELFAEAMLALRPIECRYDDLPRTICPIILGHTNGQEKALTYQTGGRSSGSVPDWKCLTLSKVRYAKIADGQWRTGERHSQAQSCVKDVDLDVNPDSPYNPKRRLPRPRLVK
jgi:hypothetical protein